MKKTVLLISLLVAALLLSSCSLFGIPTDREHFPDQALWMGAIGFDSNRNGYLSKKEVENATSLILWDECSDLSGIEYLTNLEIFSLQHGTDPKGIENLTNLKTLCISQCTDLSGVIYPPNLEQIGLYDCAFSEPFVFDSDTSVTEFEFRDCVFEKGIIFKNDSVKEVTFDDCGISGDVVFSDCDGLTDFHAYIAVDNSDFISKDYDYMKKESYSIDLSGCDNLDWIWIENGQTVDSIDLSNCSKLRTVWTQDLFYDKDKKTVTTMNLKGSPNIEEAQFRIRGINEVDISDCPHLISASEQTPYKHFGLVYESEDGNIETNNENLVLIK